MKITILFPTVTEAKYFNREDVEVYFCGVGLTASAFGTYDAIVKSKPDVIIMGGIAGVYKGVDLQIGESVVVKSEHQSDLGLFYNDGFRHLADDSLDMSFEILSPIYCPYAEKQNVLKTAVSNSMNCGIAPFVATKGVDIESMEGSSFFYVCTKLNIPFYQVRTISNVVDPAHDDWDYETSIKNLTQSLYKLIDFIKSEGK